MISVWIGRTVAALGLAVPLGAAAQSFPAKPVRIMVGSAAGGGTDIVSRLLAQKLSDLWGQPVVVENRTGASATIAADFVAKAAPDGYNVVMAVPNSHTIGPHIMKLPYDALRDFTPITLAALVPQVLVVGQGVPANSMAELVALARAAPGKFNFSSSGIGSTQHLAGEMLNLVAGVKTVHVPYKGSAPSTTALIAGEVDLTFINVPAILPHIKSGRLRALAATGTKRTELMPEVPTLREACIEGAEVALWYGVLAPAATPKDVLATLTAAVARAARAPDLRQRMLDQGAEPVGGSAEEFGALLREEVAKWREAVRAAGLKAD